MLDSKWILAVVLASCSCSPGPNPQRALEVIDPDFYAGLVPRGTKVSHVFVLKNNTSSPVAILKATGTCGCLDIAVSESTVAPLGTADVSVSLIAENAPGRREQVAVVYEQGSERGVVVCNISLTLARDRMLVPAKERVVLSGVAAKEHCEDLLVYYYSFGEKIPAVTVTGPAWMLAEVEHAENRSYADGLIEQVFRVTLSIAADNLPRLPVNDTLTVHAGVEGVAPARIAVRVEPVPDFVYKPSALFVSATAQSPEEHVVEIVRSSASDARITGVVCSNPSWKVSIEGKDPPLLVIKPIDDSGQKGFFSELVTLSYEGGLEGGHQYRVTGKWK